MVPGDSYVGPLDLLGMTKLVDLQKIQEKGGSRPSPTNERRKGRAFALPKMLLLAAEATDPAENLPDAAAAIAAVGIAIEEIHLADLLIRFRLARTRGLYKKFSFISSCKCFQL